MQLRPLALEHGTSRSGRWLRARRLRIAVAIAVVEGVLVVAGVVPRPLALLLAAALIVLYVVGGRSARSDAVRQSSWIAAASQVLVALVPALVLVVGVLALILLAVLAVVALVLLLGDRR